MGRLSEGDSQGGGDVCKHIVDSLVRQKLAQYCKTIILKKNWSANTEFVRLL